MTGPAGGYGHSGQDDDATRAAPTPWSAPVEPPPVDYPHTDYPPPSYPGYPPNPPGYQPPGYGYQPVPGSPPGYPGPAPYPGAYAAYQPGYPAPSSGNNGLAIASLITSITGLVLGIPLTLFCWVGILLPIVGVVLGIVALNQIKQTNQPGRGMAIAGIAVGGFTIAAGLIGLVVFFAIIAGSH
ncbi:hypothetical protein A9W99_25515 [Mycobacterium sp. 1164966.3]|uniref:DUF4190 domain-containing protein n=1 Tax=Mycobacterium sp. 1164966.3 TaxID=1856861 RepID=UPI0008017CB4|nr:DUF4190 domain-containing protein [Mycobacterium sp. 1164966.3]OBA77944.1 hypothetical protein A9W99_25515 [Mycobacterium sp. 1164966.3]